MVGFEDDHELPHALSALAVYYGKKGDTEKLRWVMEIVIEKLEKGKFEMINTDKEKAHFVAKTHYLETIGYISQYRNLDKKEREITRQVIDGLYTTSNNESVYKPNASEISHFYNALRLLENTFQTPK